MKGSTCLENVEMAAYLTLWTSTLYTSGEKCGSRLFKPGCDWSIAHQHWVQCPGTLDLKAVDILHIIVELYIYFYWKAAHFSTDGNPEPKLFTEVVDVTSKCGQGCYLCLCIDWFP